MLQFDVKIRLDAKEVQELLLEIHTKQEPIDLKNFVENFIETFQFTMDKPVKWRCF